MLDNQPTGSTNRCHSARVPNLNQQGLEVIGQPPALRVRILNRQHHVVGRNDCSFLYRFDPDRQPPVMLVENVFPTFSVETRIVTEVQMEEFLCFVDAFLCYDLPLEVFLFDVVFTFFGDSLVRSFGIFLSMCATNAVHSGTCSAQK